jgi:hypothetical protein
MPCCTSIIIYSLYLNKDEIAKEIIKAVIFFAAGSVSGYGINKIQNRPQTPNKD